MTGFEILNAMKHAYGIDATDYLFDSDDRERADRRPIVGLMLAFLTAAMKGAL